ncbi:XRE family transcriptional regulator [Dactylococcopsis salina]|uniref:Transcriptional regulator with C-terminal CBS domains n=1 Tax=Dactylococcopsis salina (strain PCC 8305) TaxID=13035 RepID=K9YX41_DACS8|nr:XRE family transcriptional regulator [Dactylococcopsis salina]AFZ51077.1 putative transcriptional regulator with C-terminal CBS domains [Dactylococcopsis salina PCC 8305]
MARKFSELTQNFSEEQRQRIEEKKAALWEEMSLAEIRQALSLTQSTLAETMDVGQAEISKIENRTDIFISTLRRFINAMGGELEINAVFPDRTIEIQNFSAFNQKPEHPNSFTNQLEEDRYFKKPDHS